MRNSRVLIAENERASSVVLEQAVKTASARVKVFHASSGDEALLMANREGPFDLVLLDLSLPGIDGRRVHQALRHVARAMPVVLLTTARDEAETSGFDADAYVLKPFSLGELKATIQRALSVRRNQGLVQVDPENHDEWVAWRSAETDRAAKRIRDARRDLLARGLIDEDGRRTKLGTPTDMRANSKTDLTT